MNRRAEILEQLVRFETPSAPLMRELSGFGWDWEGGPLLVLTKEHVLHVIDRYLSGDITASQLREWAENLEVREDVAFDDKEREAIDSVFFRIATPEINEPLTPEVVRRMRRELIEEMDPQSPLPIPASSKPAASSIAETTADKSAPVAPPPSAAGH